MKEMRKKPLRCLYSAEQDKDVLYVFVNDSEGFVCPKLSSAGRVPERERSAK